MFHTPLGSGSFRIGNELTQRFGATGATLIVGGAVVLLWLLTRALRSSSTPRVERRENPTDKEGPPRFNG